MDDYKNLVILKGRVGKSAPELRYLPSGDAVTSFSIATQNGKGDAEWHRLVAYKKLAERAVAEFQSGDMIYFEGKIQTRDMMTAEDKAANRKPRKIMELIADDLHLVRKKRADSVEGDDEPKPDSEPPPPNDAPDTGGGIPSYI